MKASERKNRPLREFVTALTSLTESHWKWHCRAGYKETVSDDYGLHWPFKRTFRALHGWSVPSGPESILAPCMPEVIGAFWREFFVGGLEEFERRPAIGWLPVV